MFYLTSHRFFLLSLLLLGTSLGAHSQEYIQFSTGAGYGHQSFINLDEATETLRPNGTWDIALSALGGQDGGLHLNESTASITGAPAPELEFYLAPVTDFSAPIDPTMPGTRLFNDEKSWAWGAGNSPRDTTNGLDYGWGVYNFSNHQIVGNRVFVIKLRNGIFRKLQLVSLAGGTYTLRHALLDGTDEQTASLAKAAATGPLLYFSLASNAQVTDMPSQWQLLFCRYNTPIDDGMGNLLNYGVTGILAGAGVEVAVLRGAQALASPNIHTAAYQSRLDALGHDWKLFSFSAGWLIPDSLTYLVKTPQGRVYQLTPIDFEGSSTGAATFELNDLGSITSVAVEPGHTEPLLRIFPNPARIYQPLSATFEVPYATRAQAFLYDALGRLVAQQSLGYLQAGSQTISLNQVGSPGYYTLQLQLEGGRQLSRRFIITP